MFYQSLTPGTALSTSLKLVDSSVARDAIGKVDIVSTNNPAEFSKFLLTKPQAVVFQEGLVKATPRSVISPELRSEALNLFPNVRKEGIPEKLNNEQKVFLQKHDVTKLMLSAGLIKEVRPCDMVNSGVQSVDERVAAIIENKRAEVVGQKNADPSLVALWKRDVRDLITEQNLRRYFGSSAHASMAPVVVLLTSNHGSIASDLSAGPRISANVYSSDEGTKLDLPAKSSDWRERARMALMETTKRS